MTKEVAKKIVRGITDKIECNTVDIDDWAEFWGFTREEYEEFLDVAIKALEQQPCKDVGELSDGYHTFNQLYHQRAVLFACIVKQNKNKAWKSFKHSDGKYCFDSNGEWFIVGVDTPQGSYTYHYAKEYWDMFDCQELECGKEWDGHTEDDVTRLLSLEQQPCEDCISRQVVKDMLTAEWTKYMPMEMDVNLSFILDKINVLPSVTPKTRWIPVSERLPEAMDGSDGECSDDVLICVEYDEQITISTGFYGYYPNSKTQQGWWSMWAYGCHHIDSKYKVVAWMPLPNPYKAESEDKE